MSVQAIAWAFEQPVEPGAKLVLLALANYADREGCCYPSQATLARMTSQSARTVRRHLATLEGAGAIVRSEERRRGKRGAYTSDTYRLILTASIDETARARPADRMTAGCKDIRTASPVDNMTAGPADRMAAGPPDKLTARPEDKMAAGPADNMTATSGQYDRTPIEDSLRLRLTVTEPLEDTGTGPPGKREVDAAFARFCDAYPSRGSASDPRKAARDVFGRLVAAGIDPEAMIVGAGGYAAACRKRGEAGSHFVCQKRTFLNQHRWEQYAPSGSQARQGNGAVEARLAPGCPAGAARRWRDWLAQQVAFDAARAASWFAPLVWDGERLIAPSGFHAGWVRDHFASELRAGGFDQVEARAD